MKPYLLTFLATLAVYALGMVAINAAPVRWTVCVAYGEKNGVMTSAFEIYSMPDFQKIDWSLTADTGGYTDLLSDDCIHAKPYVGPPIYSTVRDIPLTGTWKIGDTVYDQNGTIFIKGVPYRTGRPFANELLCYLLNTNQP